MNSVEPSRKTALSCFYELLYPFALKSGHFTLVKCTKYKYKYTKYTYTQVHGYTSTQKHKYTNKSKIHPMFFTPALTGWQFAKLTSDTTFWHCHRCHGQFLPNCSEKYKYINTNANKLRNYALTQNFKIQRFWQCHVHLPPNRSKNPCWIFLFFENWAASR